MFSIFQTYKKAIYLVIKMYFKVITSVCKDKTNRYHIKVNFVNNIKMILMFLKSKLLGQKSTSYERVKQSWENKHR